MNTTPNEKWSPASVLEDRPLTAAENLLLQEAVMGTHNRKREQMPAELVSGFQKREQMPAELLCGVQGSGKLFLARLADDLFRSAGWTRETDDFVIWYVPPAGMSREEAKRFSDSVMYRVYGILPREAAGGEG